MLHVLICEDNSRQRAHIESIITKHINTADVEMELILSSGDPTEVLAYLEKHPGKRGLFFLDIDLQHHEIDGMKLAVKIREIDPYAKIVFITTHSEQAYLTFQNRIGALDFIVKDRPEDIEERTIECVVDAYRLYREEKAELMKYFKVDANGEVWNIPHDDILYFETHPSIEKRVILHMESSEIDFRGILRDVASLVPAFFNCHKSFIVNPNKIVRVDKTEKEAEMVNGSRVPIAAKKMSELLGLVGDR